MCHVLKTLNLFFKKLIQCYERNQLMSFFVYELIILMKRSPDQPTILYIECRSMRVCKNGYTNHNGVLSFLILLSVELISSYIFGSEFSPNYLYHSLQSHHTTRRINQFTNSPTAQRNNNTKVAYRFTESGHGKGQSDGRRAAIKNNFKWDYNQQSTYGTYLNHLL